jgi:hypothetical protein
LQAENYAATDDFRNAVAITILLASERIRNETTLTKMQLAVCTHLLSPLRYGVEQVGREAEQYCRHMFKAVIPFQLECVSERGAQALGDSVMDLVGQLQLATAKCLTKQTWEACWGVSLGPSHKSSAAGSDSCAQEKAVKAAPGLVGRLKRAILFGAS